jgi:hypothetical protein
MRKKNRKQKKQIASSPEWHNFVPAERHVSSCLNGLAHFIACRGVITDQAGYFHTENRESTMSWMRVAWEKIHMGRSNNRYSRAKVVIHNINML